MSERWRAIGVLAVALFSVNVVARLITRFGFDGDDTAAADRVSLGMFVVVGLALAAVAFIWGKRRPVAAWGADLAAAVGIALLFTVLVGPLLVGDNPFGGGAGTFFAQIWLYLAAAGVGVLLGFLLLTALGLDHRSQSLKRYAELRATKPRRIVRR
ncbi:hypothetical protein OG777_22110 [Micromonospora peucetia]|uniref:Integral membrane protein n=1 Tax=Micromonospora peucetia TaxID=47871 RepID=A0A1C6VDY4_9ACTN|nr:hypothetical protein [Micromonospora peucetia]MCX4389604.1 hypothetical protein [Micromonospora peucetia]WSA30087.1 hypothetical protein OIE14_17870 [Micromonospora peucetia]SCL64060.1 hypothetical protein GA0070608_2893 [Micromonospora peucetia]